MPASSRGPETGTTAQKTKVAPGRKAGAVPPATGGLQPRSRRLASTRSAADLCDRTGPAGADARRVAQAGRVRRARGGGLAGQPARARRRSAALCTARRGRAGRRHLDHRARRRHRGRRPDVAAALPAPLDRPVAPSTRAAWARSTCSRRCRGRRPASFRLHPLAELRRPRRRRRRCATCPGRHRRHDGRPRARHAGSPSGSAAVRSRLADDAKPLYHLAAAVASNLFVALQSEAAS